MLPPVVERSKRINSRPAASYAGFSVGRDRMRGAKPVRKTKGDCMTKPTRVGSLILVGLIAAFTLSAGGGGKVTVWPAADVKWVDGPVKGLWVATLWGDTSKGPYGTLKKVTAGTDFGWHTHSAEQKVVAISGTFDFQAEGQEPKVLPSGSYLDIPAGVKHTSKCREGADCMYLEQSTGKMDYIPVK
jgi:ChrR-like protein with cupin domain